MHFTPRRVSLFADCFQAGNLPPVLSEACWEVHCALQAPIEAVLLAGLGASAVVLQNHDLRVTSTLKVPLVLQCGGIAASGERKSAALKTLFAPVLKFADNMPEERHCPEDETDIDVPRPSRLTIFGDTSAAGIIDQLDQGNVAIVTEEANDLFQGSTTDKLALFTHGYDGARFRFHRKRRAVNLDVRMSMTYMVQPDPFIRIISAKHGQLRTTGVLPRQLIALVTSLKGERFSWKQNHTNLPATERLHDVFREYLNRPASRPDDLEMSAAALSNWREYADHVERQLGEGQAYCEVTDFAVRSADNVARMAGIFHLLDQRIGPVQPDSVRQARMLGDRFLRQCVELFAPGGMLSPEGSAAVSLERYLRRTYYNRGQLFCKKNDVLQNGGVRPASLLDAAIGVLFSQLKIGYDLREDGLYLLLNFGNEFGR